MGKLFSDVRGVINPALIILLLLAVMIPVTIVATKQRQNLQQNAAACYQNGITCTLDNQCCTGYCSTTESICSPVPTIQPPTPTPAPYCKQNGSGCAESPECCSQYCQPGGGGASFGTCQTVIYPTPTSATPTVPPNLPNGSTCVNDADCRSGICQQYSSGKFCSSAFFGCNHEKDAYCRRPSNFVSIVDCENDNGGGYQCFQSQSDCQQVCGPTPTPTPTSTACAGNYNACDIPRRDCCTSGFVCGSNGTCVPGSTTSPTRTPTPGGGGGYSTPTPGGGGGNPTPTPGGSGINQCDTPGAAVASCNTSCPLASDTNRCGGHTYCVYSPGGNTVGPCQCETAAQTCTGGITPTPTPVRVPSCELMASCSGATCTFTNNFYLDGEKQTNYISTLQPNTLDNGTVTGWCTNRTYSHTYSSVESGPYTAELNVGFGTISTDANNDGCQDSGNPPNLQWQYSCRTSVLGTPPRCKSGLIEGNVYIDTNRNGHKDSGEANYRGATLKLTGVQNEIEISNGDGNYQFDDLPEGQYQVDISVSNYQITSQHPKTPNIDSCGDQDTADFGIIAVTPSSTPTPPTTVTPSLTPTPGTGDTIFAFSQLRMQALGSAEGGNPNPQHQQRQLTVQALSSNNQIVSEKTGTVIFNPSTGTFAGTVNMGSGISSGNYTVKVKTDRYLRKLLPGIIRVNSGTTNQMPDSTTTLLTGDINGDNKLDITDYNTFLGCYNISPVSVNCVNSDLNDNGVVDGIDYNYFVRNLGNQQGN